MRGLWETLLVLMIVVQVAMTVQSQDTDQQLLGWLTSHGGWVRLSLLIDILQLFCYPHQLHLACFSAGYVQAHLSIKKVNEEGLRGVIATRDVKEGENMAFLPGDLIVEMGSERYSSAVSSHLLAACALQLNMQFLICLMPGV